MSPSLTQHLSNLDPEIRANPSASRQLVRKVDLDTNLKIFILILASQMIARTQGTIILRRPYGPTPLKRPNPQCPQNRTRISQPSPESDISYLVWPLITNRKFQPDSLSHLMSGEARATLITCRI